jgi:hypothetical protein
MPTYDELLIDLAERDPETATELRRRRSIVRRALGQKKWVGISTVVVVAALVLVWIDARTDLDAQLVLLYLTVVGAFATAYFALLQAQESRRNTESILRPYLVMEGHNEGKPPMVKDDGLYITVRNHGGGIATQIEFDAILLPTRFDRFPTEKEFDELGPKGMQHEGRIQPLGAGHEVQFRPLSWTTVPLALIERQPWTLMVVFHYRTPYGTRQGNTQAAPVEVVRPTTATTTQ